MMNERQTTRIFSHIFGCLDAACRMFRTEIDNTNLEETNGVFNFEKEPTTCIIILAAIMKKTTPLD